MHIVNFWTCTLAVADLIHLPALPVASWCRRRDASLVNIELPGDEKKNRFCPFSDLICIRKLTLPATPIL